MARYQCVCPRTQHRRARLRWFDLPMLVALRRPFRCRHCRDRFYRVFWYNKHPDLKSIETR